MNSTDKNEQKPQNEEALVYKKILDQDDKLRKLTNEKAEQSVVNEETKVLLQLKSNYKTLTGKEWSPQSNDTHHSAMNGDASSVKEQPHETSKPKGDVNSNINEAVALSAKITELGNKIRDMKAENKNLENIKTEVNNLLKLKSQYKEMTGHEWQSATQSSRRPNKKTAEHNSQNVTGENNSKKKITRLGMETKKEDNFAEWYSQVITKSELIEYYDVSGCYILRPWSYAIWEAIRDHLDKELKNLGIQNCYFPIFVPKSALQKEETHIANFAPEVAWVTKSGDSDLVEPLAIRPTSETVMYPSYAKWLQSYRDLPIRLNQWNNVVRWEFKHPQPFIRNREFLWQEGHSAFANQNEADDEVYKILDLYANVYTNLLAVPVVKGRKSEKEKFAGSDFTVTVEAFISSTGRGIQGATSHYLGQNFSKLYNIAYEDPITQKKKYVYQNSWGLTTRAIGIMIMTHSDNKGLVLPPAVAAYQVVIVPCGLTSKISRRDKNSLTIACKRVEKRLKTAGVRVYGDYRDNYTPGWKFNYWELKGVPVRLEIGPQDMEMDRIVLVRRDTGVRKRALTTDAVFKVKSLLEYIQESLLERAQEDLRSHTILTTDWQEFIKRLNEKCNLLSPFCGNISCEEKLRRDSAKETVKNSEPDGPSMGAKSLCVPFDQPRAIKPEEVCIYPDCKNKPSAFTLFGRSY